MKKILKKIIINLTLVSLLGGIQNSLHAEDSFFDTLATTVGNYLSDLWSTRTQFIESQNPFSTENVAGLFLASSVGIATAVGTIAYGIAFVNRTKQFNAIQQWLDDTNNGTIFDFSTWLRKEYPTLELDPGKFDVREEIKAKLKNDSVIKIFNENQQKIKNPTIEEIKETIAQQQEDIKQKLNYLAQFSDIPQILLEIAGNKPEKNSWSQANELLLENKTYINFFTTYNRVGLGIIIDRYLKPLRATTPTFFHSPLKRLTPDYEEALIGGTAFQNPRTIQTSRKKNPFTWSFTFKKDQANTLYLETFIRYVRITHLKDFIDNLDSLKPVKKTKKQRKS